MKITFVTPAYYPSFIGASFYCQDLASFLTKSGHEVSVYTKLNPGWKRNEIINNVNVNRIPVKHVFGGRFYFSNNMIKKIASEKTDIIHSHHYGYFPATAGFMAAKKMKKPHVFGPYYHPPLYGFARKVQANMYHWTQGKWILKYSDAVLPHTEYEKNLLLNIGTPEKSMHILPNTVNTEKFRKISGTKKENIMLFVSNLIRDKGADVAFDIAEDIMSERKDASAVFIGNPYDNSLVERINELKKNKRMTFLNNITIGELVKWYNRASVVMLPSKYEAFSRVLAEAQACHTPVVSTRVGGVPDVVADGKSGYLVEHGDWKTMKKYVETLLDDKKLNSTMGVAGRKNIESRFSVDAVGKNLESIYKSIVFNN